MSRLARALFSMPGLRPSRRRLLILTYHRVLERPDELLPGEPDARRFEQILDWVGSSLTVLTLPEAARRLAEGTLPNRAVCLTFDDGYRNNFEIARPLLNKKGMPATFFIATGVAERGAMWNDLVIEAFRQAGAHLDLRGFGLADSEMGTIERKVDALASTLEALKYRPLEERVQTAEEIHRQVCGNARAALMMTPEMLVGLARDGHDVGAHTVNHPILKNLSDDEAKAEIVGSRDRLAALLGTTPSSFAYPNGRPGTDFDRRHQRMVGEAGFTCAVSTRWAAATRASDPMALPRFTPWETTRGGFYARLAKTYAASFAPTRHPDEPDRSISAGVQT